MRQAETILAHFPGPVTLTPSRLKLLGALALCVGVVVAFIALIVAERLYNTQEFIKAYLGIALFAGLAVYAALRLLPGAVTLTLDAGGFEIRNLWRRTRTRWQDVSDFRPREDDDIEAGKMVGAVEVLTARLGPKRTRLMKVTGVLPDNYRLSKDDLVWLMEQWRARALALLPPTTVPHVTADGWMP